MRLVPPRTRIAEQVYLELRSDLLRGAIPPGARITEQWAAERYRVSRTPIREACRRLSQEGLLSYAPSEGYRAPSVEPAETAEFYEIRMALEVVAIRNAAANPDRPAELARLRAAWDGPPVEAGEEAVFQDEAFHLSLARLGGNAALVRVLESVNARIRLIRVHDFFDRARIAEATQQHLGVLTALEDGDGDMAAALMFAHIRHSQRSASGAAERARRRFEVLDGGAA